MANVAEANRKTFSSFRNSEIRLLNAKLHMHCNWNTNEDAWTREFRQQRGKTSASEEDAPLLLGRDEVLSLADEAADDDIGRAAVQIAGISVLMFRCSCRFLAFRFEFLTHPSSER
ncbi:hypothetical protein Y032_0276g1092 [Ancylostoma ceylanicum]|uniref:Uncharacterized protein n=1 Tax=Ancylostoma ceylanicum TaxID=53326 RepID=A0A016S7L9_9BILA|nr:hypothetical protein Y032_0276g1092 [Ancylostoma ceylanicum]